MDQEKRIKRNGSRGIGQEEQIKKNRWLDKGDQSSIPLHSFHMDQEETRIRRNRSRGMNQEEGIKRNGLRGMDQEEQMVR